MRNLKKTCMMLGLLPVVMLFTAADAFGQSSRQQTKDANVEQQQMRTTLSDVEYAEWKLNATKKTDEGAKGKIARVQRSFKTEGGGHSDLEAPKKNEKNSYYSCYKN